MGCVGDEVVGPGIVPRRMGSVARSTRIVLVAPGNVFVVDQVRFLGL